MAWDNAPSSRIMVSLLLPGPMEADQWLHKVRANSPSAHPLGTWQCLRQSDKSNKSSFCVSGFGRMARSIDVPAVTRRSFVAHIGGLFAV